MRRLVSRHQLVVGCLSLLLFLPQPAQAQLGRTQGQVTALYDLKTALPYIDWNSRTKGPLIAITPEKVRNLGLTNAEAAEYPTALQPIYAPSEKSSLDADAVARHFLHQLIQLATLSIVAPTKMTILNSHLSPANPFRDAPIYDNMNRLEATLTTSQWQMLGRLTGLGMADLSKDQEPLFDAVLPETMTIDRETTRDYGDGFIGNESVPASERTLTPEQRENVRLYLKRETQMNLVDEENQWLPIARPFHSDNREGEKTGLVNTSYTPDSWRKIFGQAVSEEVPNRLKPSDLDLKQPLLAETWVPLTGVKTVGDMLRATSKATNLELHADDHLARLSVYVSTEARLVHASDLLEALCYGLTATYRKVGPVPGGDPKDFAYVLTYDRAGLAAQRGMLANWAQRGMAIYRESGNKFDAALRKMKPRQYVNYAEGDPLNPTKDALLALHESVEDQEDTGTFLGYGTIPVSALTAAQSQQMVEGLKQVDQYNRNAAKNDSHARPITALTDRVSMRDAITIAYVIPGVGKVPAGFSWTNGAFTQDFPSDNPARTAKRAANRAKRQEAGSVLEASMKKAMSLVALGRVMVCIAPATVEEALPMLAAAPALGVSEVWVAMPDGGATDADRRLLAACATAGAAHGVRVGAQVSLIRISAFDTQRETAAPEVAWEDRNVFGETGAQWAARFALATEGIDARYIRASDKERDTRDILAAEAPTARTSLAARLQTIAALPGIATLAIRDAAAPGRDWSSSKTQERQDWAGFDFGYTVADRLTFLRQSGYDPIDVPSAVVNDRVENATKLPRFDFDTDENLDSGSKVDGTKAVREWSDYRAMTERDLLRGIRADLHKTHSATAVYLASYETDTSDQINGEFQLWTDLEIVPFDAVNFPTGKASALKAVASSSARKPNEALPYFALGKMFAQSSSNPSPSDLNVIALTAFYIYLGLPNAARPSESPAVPGIILDMSGMKPPDAVTFLRGTLEALTGKAEKK